MDGFGKLMGNFKSKFGSDRWNELSSKNILKRTQSYEAEMRAAMELVDEYGREGWVLDDVLYWDGGENVEIDALNLEKGILAETKSGIPEYKISSGQRRTLEGWIESNDFKEWIGKRVEGLKKNGLYGKINKFELAITREMLGGKSVSEIEELIKSVLREEGIGWGVKVRVIEV